MLPLPLGEGGGEGVTRAVSDRDILGKLRSVFGYEAFRPLQGEIVDAILEGRDVFVLMPTGGGKSLCYQLPALVRDGITVVVSPLIALMKDQVDALQANGVAAMFINSSLDGSEIGRRQAAVARGDVKLLYVAPERLMTPPFLHLLQRVPVHFFAIDEAHCISEWGHDFRPEYRALTQLRELFPAIALGAFTATATRRVQADIVGQLKLERAAAFRGSFNRPNLYYDARPKYAADQQLVAYVQAHPDASGIVYCFSRAETERVADVLAARGFQAAAYHAGLGSQERKRRQEAFIKDDVRIIVATIAFGMGIDKPDVRYVIHYDVPRSLEGYFQESGRAGRDGDPSDCILFYSYADIAKHDYFINQKSPEEQAVERQQLRQMANWADNRLCRRWALLAYFDEAFEGQPGACCDVCSDPAELVEYTIPVQMLLSCIKRTGERFGITYVIDVLRGSQNERILRLGHDKLSTFGIGRDRPKEEWQHVARQLLQQGYLRQEGEYNVVTVTERGQAVLFKGEPVSLAPPRKAPARVRVEVPLLGPSGVLFERLRALRKRLADERSVPPYVIFHDSVVRQMVALLPTTRVDLLRLTGVGERKADDYGDPFLDCVAEFVRETGARPTAVDRAPPSAKSPAPRSGLGASARETLRLFNEGHDIAEIGSTRRLALSTVEDHLAEAIEAGEPIDVDRLVHPSRRQAIEAAIAELGSSPLLKPIRELLGGDYTYAEIRFVRAAVSRAE